MKLPVFTLMVLGSLTGAWINRYQEQSIISLGPILGFTVQRELVLSVGLTSPCHLKASGQNWSVLFSLSWHILDSAVSSGLKGFSSVACFIFFRFQVQTIESIVLWIHGPILS